MMRSVIVIINKRIYIYILDDSSVNDLCTAWRKGLRRIWSVPYNTHGNILYGLSGDLPIYDEICKRSLHFVATCLHCSCDLIVFFLLHAMVLHVLVALHYFAEISLLARRGITLQLAIFY